MTFEDALAKMEESVDKLRNQGTTLAESITSFEDGMKNYQLCMDLLHSAEQKIEIFRRSEQEDRKEDMR